jgi:RecA-family ATPase
LERFLTIDDLGQLPPPKWLIDGLFEQDGLVMLVGPPGSFKSFLAIDWALSLAVGRPWNERAVQPARVLYALGEGKASLLKRLKAWMWRNQLTEDEKEILNANFRVTFDVPQLAVHKNFGEFEYDLDMDGFNPTVFIIDTLARSYVGKNENDPMDVGIWVENADKLRQRGMAVIALHHTKKNTEFGLQYRGSTAFPGAMDSMFTLERAPEGFKGYAKLTCTKQKDHQEPDDVWMRWEQVRPPDNQEGSIVLVEASKPNEEAEEEKQVRDAAIDLMINSLLEDGSYESDRARARELSMKMDMLEGTAQTRISRARRKNK